MLTDQELLKPHEIERYHVCAVCGEDIKPFLWDDLMWAICECGVVNVEDGLMRGVWKLSSGKEVCNG